MSAGDEEIHRHRPSVKALAEFSRRPLEDEYDQSSDSNERTLKVINTKLYYTYPLKLLVPACASTAPSCQWLYILSFGGGLVEGDHIFLEVKVGEDCTVVVTTQASTKVYNSDEGLATQQELSCQVADGGLLAVLPDPLVCFSNAIYNQKQVFELTTGGNVIVLDWLTAGRMALGEVWDMTSYNSHNKVFVDGRLVFGDSISLRSETNCLSLKELMGDALVLGSCVFIGPFFKHIKQKIKDKVCELTKFNDMSVNKKEMVAFASIIDPVLCEGVVVKLVSVKSTEQAYSFFRTIIGDIIPRIGGDPLQK